MVRGRTNNTTLRGSFNYPGDYGNRQISLHILNQKQNKKKEKTPTYKSKQKTNTIKPPRAYTPIAYTYQQSIQQTVASVYMGKYRYLTGRVFC